MERVLRDPKIKAAIGAVATGLASDCDAAEPEVEGLMRAHLPDASTLPFAGFVTCEGTWVAGFSGFKDAAEFAKVLAVATASPLRDATPEVRGQLEKVAAAATAAAARGDWKPVLQAARTAAASSGRCPEREAVRAAEAAARDWVREQFDAVVRDAVSGADLAPARKRLAEVRRHFAGEAEAVEAETGTKAVARLTQIRAAEAAPNAAPDLRAKAAKTFEGTRWPALFAKDARGAQGR